MRLSIQLYTVRDQLANDARGTFQRIKAAGIDYVEGGGFYGADSPAHARAMLEELGLKVSGSHVPVERLENEMSAVIDDAKTLGAGFVIVPWVDKTKIGGDWAAFGKSLEGYGERLRDAGLELCYHNHDFEFEGGNGLAAMRDATSDAVRFEVDAMWVHRGGLDPVTVIDDLGSRVRLLHLKDYRPDASPIWVPAGEGVVDLPAVVKAGEALGVPFGCIELDESPNNDPLAAVEASATYLRSLGLS